MVEKKSFGPPVNSLLELDILSQWGLVPDELQYRKLESKAEIKVYLSEGEEKLEIISRNEKSGFTTLGIETDSGFKRLAYICGSCSEIIGGHPLFIPEDPTLRKKNYEVKCNECKRTFYSVDDGLRL